VRFFCSITLFCSGTRGGEELLINTVLKAKLIERGIPEFDPSVTANGFQAVGMLIVQLQD
jgi:hypothetical protein